MAKVYEDRIITSIDVGTTKICVLIAQHLEDDQVEILGMGKAPSKGLRKGVVVDVAKTIHSIKAAVKEAELMAGITVESAYIGIAGAHISSVNSHGMVPIKKGEVRKSDIKSVLEAAQTIQVPEGQQILHVLPQYFIIDGEEKVHDPLGMHGIRLEVQAHIILGAITSVQNLIKCCERAGVRVRDVVLEQLASAKAVLSKDERELGVGVLDIGGGTSDLALYQNGSIRHTMILPVAGDHFTNDVAVGLHTTLECAQRIKEEYGDVSEEKIESEETIEIEKVYGRETEEVSRQKLVDILRPRAQELLALIHEEIITNNLETFITTGIVLTGGGSLLKGLPELAEEIIGVSARVGRPQLSYDFPETLDNPIYATGYGLLLHALKEQQSAMHSLQGPLAKRVYSRMKSWVSDFF